MTFELTLSVGDLAAVATVGVMLYGFQWKISKIFNSFCTELKLVKQDVQNLKERLEHLEVRL